MREKGSEMSFLDHNYVDPTSIYLQIHVKDIIDGSFKENTFYY